ncbi:MAG TPA: DUF5722 domain-containing protein [Gaiellaceae bacterium]|nr:DUF5722 domain-containing protein [Gaiellaceae bacterium]
MSNRIALLAAAGVAAVTLAVPSALAHTTAPKRAQSSHLLIGINDEAYTLYGNPAEAFQAIRTLKVQVLRVNLYWGGNKWAVADKKPTDASDPGDQNYNWAIYDRLARYAWTNHVQLMFSIVGTPSWANGGKGRTVPPKNYATLQTFATTAATRYDGFFVPPAWQQDPTLAGPTAPLPVVNLWTAWNEPNNPVFLTPQYKKAGKKWVVESAVSYAHICNAIYEGVHAVSIEPGALTDTTGRYKPTKEMVACGVTDPRGNDSPSAGKRSSVDPLTFLTAAHAAKMGPFDVYAHNPYASAGNESPTYVPKGNGARRVQFGNLGVLLALVKKYYGAKHLWITEYGYQTPPDKTVFSTSTKNQAAWLTQSVKMARANPRIDIFIWYLIKDEPDLAGWQSGLETSKGKHKPSWAAFVKLPRG